MGPRPVRPSIVLDQSTQPLMSEMVDSADGDLAWRSPVVATTPSKGKFSVVKTQLRRRGWVLRLLTATSLLAIYGIGSTLFGHAEPTLRLVQDVEPSGRNWKQVLSAVGESTWTESWRLNSELRQKVNRLLHGSASDDYEDEQDELTGESLFADLLPARRPQKTTVGASYHFAAQLAQLDVDICGKADCQFLVAAYVAEQVCSVSGLFSPQSSKRKLPCISASSPRWPRRLTGRSSCRGSRRAAIAVATPSTLAPALTLTCSPFEAYYDLDGFRELFDVQAVPWETFERYTRRRAELGNALDAVHVEVMRTKKRSFSLDELDAIPDAEDAQCLEDMPFASNGPIGYQLQGAHNPDGSDDLRFALTEEIVDTMSTHEVISDTAAVIVTWRLQFRMFPSPTGRPMGKQEADPLPLSKEIERLADATAEKLGPYAVLHWRLEEVDRVDEAMPEYVRCAEEAIKAIAQFKDLKSVFFATDFPLLGYDHPHSDTFVVALQNSTELVKATTAGVDRLLAGFGNSAIAHTPLLQRRSRMTKSRRQSFEPLSVYLTNQHVEKPSIRFPDTAEPTLLEDYDSGMTGVFDRLISERAQVFLTGEPRVCARYSNFVIQILNERKSRQERGDGNIQSLIDYFGPPSGRSGGPRWSYPVAAP